MTENDKANEQPERGRRKYERPRILSREPLEVMAAVCAPRPPAKTNPGFCPQGPVNS
ncbi:MAG TPA: hypothetical protein VF698_18005 [Thermoanaerobaculia bacterium]|jgi:hypothetical protein